MDLIFEELDHQSTPLGEISLRRRTEPRLDNVLIYEVKLGDEFLMSSLFTEAEEQLASLGIAKLLQQGMQSELEIVVGGLGLGYTALTALQHSQVKRVRTIDVMEPVIRWHQSGVLPIGDVLASDQRSELIHADFFAVASNDRTGFFDEQPVDALLLDIDHSPSHWLNESNQGFYTHENLSRVAQKINKDGVFALWSNEMPDQGFIDLLNSVFSNTESHVVKFPNPYSGGESINSVYVSTV